MTQAQLAQVLEDRLNELGITRYQLRQRLHGKTSHQTVYNALDGRPIKTDTLLVIMRELGLKMDIVATEKK